MGGHLKEELFVEKRASFVSDEERCSLYEAWCLKRGGDVGISDWQRLLFMSGDSLS